MSKMKNMFFLFFVSIFLVLLNITVASDLSVSIYNNNLGLVREVRALDLNKGLQEYRFVDVAAQIDPTSVHFKTIESTSDVSLLEQNFEYDLIGTDRLLQKYIDKEIHALIKDGLLVEGTLLNAQGGDVILKTKEDQIRVVKSAVLESIIFPSLPQGLITKPTLVWLLDSKKGGKQNAEISYLTKGVNWHAEYVAVVNDKDTALDLAGWVSIENNSGATYDQAKIKLIAGDVNVVQPSRLHKADYSGLMLAEAAAPQFEEKEFFEYHLYTLQRPATIKDRQIKQLSLFSPQTASVVKLFIYDGQQNGNKVNVKLELKNSTSNGLGMPLPQGKVRVYKKDSDEAQEFIGEDKIDHTPKDEMIRLLMGNAFDITGERIVKDSRQISKNSRQQTIEITLRNHKKENVNITIVEHFYGNYSFIGPTPPVIKKTADRAEFAVEVTADAEKTFSYTVLFQY